MSKQPKALRLANRPIIDRGFRWHTEATTTLRRQHAENERLHAENERLRALIRLDDAEWRDKEIWPVRGDAYQAWLVQVYLPVPLSAADKSPEAALQRALAQEVRP